MAIIFMFSPRYRIGPFEVESALIQHPAVMESAVVSSPDPVRGEVKRKKKNKKDVEINIFYSKHEVLYIYEASLEWKSCKFEIKMT